MQKKKCKKTLPLNKQNLEEKKTPLKCWKFFCRVVFCEENLIGQTHRLMAVEYEGAVKQFKRLAFFKNAIFLELRFELKLFLVACWNSKLVLDWSQYQVLFDLSSIPPSLSQNRRDNIQRDAEELVQSAPFHLWKKSFFKSAECGVSVLLLIIFYTQ